MGKLSSVIPVVLLLIVCGLQLAKGSSDNSPVICVLDKQLHCPSGIIVAKEGKCVCYGSSEPVNTIPTDSNTCDDQTCMAGNVMSIDGKCVCYCLTETSFFCRGGVIPTKDGKCVCRGTQNKIEEEKKKDAAIYCPEIMCPIGTTLIIRDGKCSCEYDGKW